MNIETDYYKNKKKKMLDVYMDPNPLGHGGSRSPRRRSPRGSPRSRSPKGYGKKSVGFKANKK